jgi:hypothetical protein
VKRPRNHLVRRALSMLGESGLIVNAVIEGGKHTRVKLDDGRSLILSRGASKRDYGALLLRRDVNRLLRTGGERP